MGIALTTPNLTLIKSGLGLTNVVLSEQTFLKSYLILSYDFHKN